MLVVVLLEATKNLPIHHLRKDILKNQGDLSSTDAVELPPQTHYFTLRALQLLRNLVVSPFARACTAPQLAVAASRRAIHHH